MTSKIKVSSEIGYLAAIVLLSLAVAMLSAADFGIYSVRRLVSDLFLPCRSS